MLGWPPRAEDGGGRRRPAPVGARDDDRRLWEKRRSGRRRAQRDVQRAGDVPAHPVPVVTRVDQDGAAELEVGDDAVRRQGVLAPDAYPAAR